MTSLLGEIEIWYCIALNCIGTPVGENSNLFNLLLDYIELLYDWRDVIADMEPYFKILLP